MAAGGMRGKGGSHLAQGLSAPAPHPEQRDPHHRQGLWVRGCVQGGEGM